MFTYNDKATIDTKISQDTLFYQKDYSLLILHRWNQYISRKTVAKYKFKFIPLF